MLMWFHLPVLDRAPASFITQTIQKHMAKKLDGSVRLTKTDFPKYQDTEKNPATNRKWRVNYPSGEVDHHWANNTIPHGACGNVFFEDAIIYSYGRHFPIARHVIARKTKRKLILFTTDKAIGYGRGGWGRGSSSTSQHKRGVMYAIPQSRKQAGDVLEVPDVMADTRDDHRANLEWFRKEATETYDKAYSATRNKPWLLEKVLEIIRDGNAYAGAVGLTERIGSLLGGDLASFEAKVREEIRASEAKQEALDATADERFEKRNAAQIAAYERDMEDWRSELKKWQDCLRNDIPEKPQKPSRSRKRRSWYSWDDTTYVRVSRDKFLQTSKGMTVPLDAVLPILEEMRRYSETVRQLLVLCNNNPDENTSIKALADALEDQSIRVTEEQARELVHKKFEINVRGSSWSGAIDWERKIVQIGCHRVSFEEIERAAQAAGL